MAAYILVEVDVHNPEEYEDYKKLTPASLEPFNGKFIVRGGATETLEGDWLAKRIVVLEFPTKELAKQWWRSEEYAPAKALRQRTATTKMILVEGVAHPDLPGEKAI
jgi:uncharacterized protein (DUF1330 family)